MMRINPDIVTLYRYFAYAAHMRRLFRNEFDPEWMRTAETSVMGLLMFFYSPPGIYLLYSYSGMYLVIEGWKDLKLTDPEIDELITSPFVDRLRLFRNATFHYQKEPLSWKHLQFFGTEEERTEKWLNALYNELQRFFGENTLPIPDDLREAFKDKTHVEIARIIRLHWRDKIFEEPAGEPSSEGPPAAPPDLQSG